MVSEIVNTTANATQNSSLMQHLQNPSGLFDFLYSYLTSIPSQIIQGDMFALILSLITFFVAILIINKLSGLMLIVLKRIVVLIISLAALFYFSQKYFGLLAQEGWTIKLIILGVLGSILALASMSLGVYQLIHHTKKHISEKREEIIETEISKSGDKEVLINSNTIASKNDKGLRFKDFANVNKIFSKESIKGEKSLMSVITYLLIGEFGVFSSKTISAPNTKIGIIIFAVFVLGSFVFIKQSYKDYKLGLEHLAVTFILATVLSFVLGYAWSNYAFSFLFSLNFFTTECLVAIITGTAVALFAGSR